MTELVVFLMRHGCSAIQAKGGRSPGGVLGGGRPLLMRASSSWTWASTRLCISADDGALAGLRAFTALASAANWVFMSASWLVKSTWLSSRMLTSSLISPTAWA